MSSGTGDTAAAEDWGRVGVECCIEISRKAKVLFADIDDLGRQV